MIEIWHCLFDKTEGIIKTTAGQRRRNAATNLSQNEARVRILFTFSLPFFAAMKGGRFTRDDKALLKINIWK